MKRITKEQQEDMQQEKASESVNMYKGHMCINEKKKKIAAKK